jgi:hypothetical protein
MLEMPTIDKTEEWEESLNHVDGTIKFPVTFFDSIDMKDIETSLPSVAVSLPRFKKTTVKEIKIGKRSKNKGNELF